MYLQRLRRFLATLLEEVRPEDGVMVREACALLLVLTRAALASAAYLSHVPKGFEHR